MGTKFECVCDMKGMRVFIFMSSILFIMNDQILKYCYVREKIKIEHIRLCFLLLIFLDV